MQPVSPASRPVKIGKIARQALVAWFKDGAPSMGAAISFYSLFAIAPILLIAIWVAGAFVGPQVVAPHVLEQVRYLLGDEASKAVSALLVSVSYATRGGYSAAAGILTLLIGATSVFAELQNALDRIWHTPQRDRARSVWRLLRARLLSFGFILGVGFLLLVSLTAGAALEMLAGWIGAFTTEWRPVALALNAVLGFVLSILLFAMIFKYVPNQSIPWSDVWVGSVVTAALFMTGKLLIVLFLGRVAFRSAYGIAGAFLVLLLWVYYSAQIFLLGAEFTCQYAFEHGSKVLPPSRDAISADPSPE
jgi:membrane protein